MIGLLRAEMIKTFRRKLVWIMAAIMGWLMAMVAAVFYLAPRYMPEEIPGLPTLMRPEAFAVGVQQAVSQTWLPIVLVVVLFGAETAGPVWRTALTLESRRWIHLVAKAVVGTLAGWIVITSGIVVWSGLTLFLAEGSGAPAPAEWAALLGKVVLTTLAWTGIGLAAAGWLRSLGGALGAGIGFSLFEGVFVFWDGWQDISIGLASQRLFGRFLEVSGMGVGVTGDMSLDRAYLIVLGWAVAGLGAAMASVYLREP